MDANTTIGELVEDVAAFRDERNWLKFHTPKNLSMSIAIEAAELMECFQWGEGWPSPGHAADELADVLIYCLSFASVCGWDVAEIIRDKMARNAAKYPAPDQLPLFAQSGDVR